MLGLYNFQFIDEQRTGAKIAFININIPQI